ncbi:hypothetical protein [Yinghuangia soli]|uniref:Uncharacterized protein n=1 Tax=Yinghuangia soli TaxID=2908204 RepID=A0AA41PZD0_9ACTN|nr:hypothetical protein [Yinghuangia soli]MCF2528670.1 hypothetical protein [Yinghuangia soli]
MSGLVGLLTAAAIAVGRKHKGREVSKVPYVLGIALLVTQVLGFVLVSAGSEHPLPER